jgi:hypothetical protein
MIKRAWPTSLCMLLVLTGCSGEKGNYDLHKTLALIIITGIILLFFVLALYSNILRDEVNDCDAFDVNTEKLRKKLRLKFIKSDNPFSLSRVQLAVWTVIISCSYIYLQLCMPVCSNTDINKTALILMGISAAVTTAGTIMDKREIQDARDRHQNTPSEGFFVDILSDDNGVSIHRFQNVIWTGIAMIIYLNKIYAIKTGCALPELDETLLALTGISSATYLAIKSQENNPAVEESQLPGAAQPVSNSYVDGIANIPAPVVPATTQTMVDEVNATASSPANVYDNNGNGAV